MGRGAEQQELGVAVLQIRAASAEAAGKNGVARLAHRNGVELSERSMGAIGAILLLTAVASLLSDYSALIIGVCILIAAGIGLYAWSQRRRLYRLREHQMRDHTRRKMQEDETNA